MLDAAAWTYVAAAVSAVGVGLFYVFVLLFRGRQKVYGIKMPEGTTMTVQNRGYTSPIWPHGGSAGDVSRGLRA